MNIYPTAIFHRHLFNHPSNKCMDDCDGRV